MASSGPTRFRWASFGLIAGYMRGWVDTTIMRLMTSCCRCNLLWPRGRGVRSRADQRQYAIAMCATALRHLPRAAVIAKPQEYVQSRRSPRGRAAAYVQHQSALASAPLIVLRRSLRRRSSRRRPGFLAWLAQPRARWGRARRRTGVYSESVLVVTFSGSRDSRNGARSSHGRGLLYAPSKSALDRRWRGRTRGSPRRIRFRAARSSRSRHRSYARRGRSSAASASRDPSRRHRAGAGAR